MSSEPSAAHDSLAHPSGISTGRHTMLYEPTSFVPRHDSKSGTWRYAGGREPLPPTIMGCCSSSCSSSLSHNTIGMSSEPSAAHDSLAHPSGISTGRHTMLYEPTSFVPRHDSKSGTWRYAGGREPAELPSGASPLLHSGSSVFTTESLVHDSSEHPSGISTGMHHISDDPSLLVSEPRHDSKSGTRRYAGGRLLLPASSGASTLVAPASERVRAVAPETAAVKAMAVIFIAGF